MKTFVNKLLSIFGYRFKKIESEHFLNPHNFSHSLDIFIRYYKINLVLVIGAHDGKFYRSLKKSGYRGKTISYEPSHSNFEKLKNNNKYDQNHKIIKIGFGKKNEKKKLLITRPEGDTNTLSHISKKLIKLNKKKYTSTFEVVDIKNSKNYFSKNINFKKKILLKIDAAGYDFIILKNLRNIVDNFYGIIVDASINETDNLYKVDTPMIKFIKFMNSKKFKLHHINTEKIDTSTGRLIRTELFFVKRSLII